MAHLLCPVSCFLLPPYPRPSPFPYLPLPHPTTAVPCPFPTPTQVMTSVVELMSNAIGHKQAQQLGQEALRELSGMYDTLDGRPPPESTPAPPAVSASGPATKGSAGGAAGAGTGKPPSASGGRLLNLNLNVL